MTLPGRSLRNALAGLAAVLVVALPAFAFAAGGGAGRDRQVTLLFIYIVLVVGLQVFTGNSGVFSLGHAGIAGVAGYTTAVLSAAPSIKALSIADAPLGLADVQLPVWSAMAVAVAIALVFSFVTGAAISRLAGVSAVIVTFALLQIVDSGLKNWKSLTGGSSAFFGFPTGVEPLHAAAVAAVAAAVAVVFRRSRAGVQLQASREDHLAAAAMGVDVAHARLLAWVLSGMVVAVGGALLALFVGAINPSQYHLNLTILLIAMLVLGGKESVAGAVFGGTLVFVGSEAARYLGDGGEVAGMTFPVVFGLPHLFLGAVVLAVMLLRPAGLTGDRELDDVAAALWSRLRRTAPLAAQRSAHRAPTAAGDRTERAAVLEVLGASKRFDGLVALDDVTLSVQRGEIVGLIGPNGAGKTTLINAITSVAPPTRGHVRLGAHDLAVLSPAQVARRGVARTFQNLRLFKSLDVRTNISVAAGVAARHRPGVEAPDVDELLDAFGLADVAHRRSGALPYGSQRTLELARAVALAPDFLLLDEPAAGMNSAETTLLLDDIRRIRDAYGAGIVVIDHDLHFVLNLCARVYVLNGGRLIAAGTPEEIRRDPAVVEAYLGRHAEAATIATTRQGHTT